ncbi:MAG: hypothetical protein QG567_1949 [Campylobacterota bacterium]|nr:hypothetical protein [Campylobacterota bacterium]
MNYHLFVVDEISLKYHIEYGFVGTGNSSNNFNIGLWKDIARLKINDKIVFYVQKTKKFYGFFKVTSSPFYDAYHYLQPNLLPFLGDNKNVILQYRALITPDVVFQYGIDEFDLIDILPNNVTDILWSILYRKLKGGRGCSPIFENEFNIVFNRVSNNNIQLNVNPLSFSNLQIIRSQNTNNYKGAQNNPNIKNIIMSNSYTEHHIHALLIEYLPNLIFNNISWLGNEVYSGAGMQAIDILTIDNSNIFNIIEIKKEEIPHNITKQVEKYIQWLQNRFQNFIQTSFQPIIIGKKINGTRKRNLRKNEFTSFNNQNVSNSIQYFEYEIINNGIVFNKIDYMNNWNILGSQTI